MGSNLLSMGHGQRAITGLDMACLPLPAPIRAITPMGTESNLAPKPLDTLLRIPREFLPKAFLLEAPLGLNNGANTEIPFFTEEPFT